MALDAQRERDRKRSAGLSTTGKFHEALILNCDVFLIVCMIFISNNREKPPGRVGLTGHVQTVDG